MLHYSTFLFDLSILFLTFAHYFNLYHFLFTYIPIITTYIPFCSKYFSQPKIYLGIPLTLLIPGYPPATHKWYFPQSLVSPWEALGAADIPSQLTIPNSDFISNLAYYSPIQGVFYILEPRYFWAFAPSYSTPSPPQYFPPLPLGFPIGYIPKTLGFFTIKNNKTRA